jgi:hypothetical protein
VKAGWRSEHKNLSNWHTCPCRWRPPQAQNSPPARHLATPPFQERRKSVERPIKTEPAKQQRTAWSKRTGSETYRAREIFTWCTCVSDGTTSATHAWHQNIWQIGKWIVPFTADLPGFWGYLSSCSFFVLWLWKGGYRLEIWHEVTAVYWCLFWTLKVQESLIGKDSVEIYER